MLQPTFKLAAPSWVQPHRVQLVPCSYGVRRNALRTFNGSTSVAAEPITAPPTVAHSTLLAPEAAHFEDDSTVFVEEFRIRGNEAGPDQRANIITIANLLQVGLGCSGLDHQVYSLLNAQLANGRCYCLWLQEVGGNHGVAMWGRASSGFAAMPGMDHLIFVATRMQIRMEAYPSW